MSRNVLTALTVAASFLTSAASAVTVKNLDDTEHKVSVVEGDSKQDHVVKPGGTLEGICLKGCLIRLDDSDDDPYELEGSEATSIEKGQLWGDEPEEPAAPSDGNAGEPAPPGPQP